MSTAIQDILSRALGYSVQNAAPDLTASSSEMISVVAGFERDIYRVAAQDNRYFVDIGQTVTSTNASANRTADLSALTPAVERLFRVTLPGGTWVSLVDYEDTDAELAPRAYVLGQTLYEVGSEWGATGAVALGIDYGVKPATLDPTSNMAQTVTLPDEYTDLLVLRLAAYLSEKDTGRDPAEAQGFDALYQQRLQDVLAALASFGGRTRRRFLAPNVVPGGSE